MLHVIHADARDHLTGMIERGEMVHSIVTDPPYGLVSVVKRFGATGAAPAKSNGPTGVFRRASAGFMGQRWDGTGIEQDPEFWRLCLGVLPPGGHMLAFSSPRTAHRMTCAIEDAGFEIRNTIMWLYASGFPKSKNVGLFIDKQYGHGNRGRAIPHASTHLPSGVYKTSHLTSHEVAHYQGKTTDGARWEGWGTDLKPAWEPIILARKPLDGTVAQNVLRYNVGALNIDACRIATDDNLNGGAYAMRGSPRDTTWGAAAKSQWKRGGAGEYVQPSGRWPANVAHEEGVLDAKFFYTTKASKRDRGATNDHPTVKPHDLLRWLVRMVTPPGGTVLDPFAGSGSTGKAAQAEGMNAILIEKEARYVEIMRSRPGVATLRSALERLSDEIENLTNRIDNT